MEIQGTDVEGLLATVWDAGGTDLILAAGAVPMGRIDGQLRALPHAQVTPDEMHHLLKELLDGGDLGRLEEARELDFAFSWGERARVRGNAFYQRGELAVALRLIPDVIPTFDQIGLPQSVRALAGAAQGLVLFTGPTGSGKSTSLASLVEWINHNRACHIITIEDPIEYLHDNSRSLVNQREVGLDTRSFERALRSALREDPDVVLVGEMRDIESIAITLTLAATGHLLFSTLHTHDAAQALDRIVDVFPSERQAQIRLQLAGSLLAVVAQRLIPKVGGGLVAAFEVLTANSAVKNLLREGKTQQLRNAISLGRGDGMQTLEDNLSALVHHGWITPADAEQVALVPKELELEPPPTN